MSAGLSPLAQVLRIGIVVAIVAIIAVAARLLFGGPSPGHVVDEAMAAHRSAASFQASADPYFKDMDGGVALTPAGFQGRNTWMVWTGGNDRFWDKVSTTTFGNFDLLKVLSSYPGLKASRDNRWTYLGLSNEPCFQKAQAPDPDRFGLWLDKRTAGCAPDPFEDAAKYPGVAIGARGKTMPVGSFYGYATGVLGLRLFPNPAFDAEAKRKWDPVRFYTDPSYYNSKELVRPYRVGMACAFCHVGPSPTAPPADPENPQFANLSATVGAQYYWVDRIFSWPAQPNNYLYQLFHTSRPGALDTSLVSTDYINNPRTMNAVYQLGARLQQGHLTGKESLSQSNLQNRQLPGYFDQPNTVWTPHVLKDGSDSVGALGALNRVYLNIGLFSEEWLLHFNAFVGGQPSSPIPIATARKNSSYWNATEAQTPGMAQFLLAASGPHKLSAAPGGATYLTEAPAVVAQGRGVFAERCARCHSSKLPPIPKGANPSDCTGPNYLSCWNRYWAWSKTPQFKTQMRAIVDQPDFLTANFLSTEIRVPVSLLKTNLCSPLAANALKGMIWDDFSSDTYKQLPSVGKVEVMDPITGRMRTYQMPADGRGYTRPASLVSVWSTAPYLLNNSVGHFEEMPDTASRMRAFDDGIRQLLWPEKRAKDSVYPAGPGLIDRLREPAYLAIPRGYLPGGVGAALGPLSAIAPSLFVKTTHPLAFTGATARGSAVIGAVSVANPIGVFTAGAAVTGPGIPAGAHVVRYDAVRRELTINQPATAAAAAAALQTTTPEEGVRIGPIPAGTPVNLLAAIEVAPEHGDLVSRVRHDASLVSLLLAVKHDAAALQRAKDPAEQARLQTDLNSRLYGASKCPDYVVNRGHYFGTDLLGEEPGLSDDDKNALIAFLKQF